VQDCYNFFTSQFRQHAKKLVQFSLKDFMDKNLATLQPVKEKRRGKRRTNVKAADPVISQEIRLTQFWPQSTD
jgi:hypothetical protein